MKQTEGTITYVRVDGVWEEAKDKKQIANAKWFDIQTFTKGS